MKNCKTRTKKLENQICFPLYACSKELIRRYKPLLDKFDLTYTQYITMLAIWEKKSSTVSDLGRMLYLDSGTLTPLLKKLESKGYVKRTRSTKDERTLNITLTSEGEALKAKTASIPEQYAKTLPLDAEELKTLHALLAKILEESEEEDQ